VIERGCHPKPLAADAATNDNYVTLGHCPISDHVSGTPTRAASSSCAQSDNQRTADACGCARFVAGLLRDLKDDGVGADTVLANQEQRVLAGLGLVVDREQELDHLRADQLLAHNPR
jgi:hypothetical protein